MTIDPAAMPRIQARAIALFKIANQQAWETEVSELATLEYDELGGVAGRLGTVAGESDRLADLDGDACRLADDAPPTGFAVGIIPPGWTPDGCRGIAVFHADGQADCWGGDNCCQVPDQPWYEEHEAGGPWGTLWHRAFYPCDSPEVRGPQGLQHPCSHCSPKAPLHM